MAMVPEVASALHQDIKAVKPSRKLTAVLADLSIDDAYAISHEVRRLRQTIDGEEVIGYKIGCTGAAVRQTLGINESVIGNLWAKEQYPDESTVLLDDFHGAAIEGELAVRVLSTDGPVSGWRVAYTPIIELHHAEFVGPAEHRAVELISRNCIHAGVVGDWEDAPECTLCEIPLDVPLKVSFNGRLLEEPVLENLQMGGLQGPVATVSWLVEKLERLGKTIMVGEVILTSTPGDLIPVREALEISVEFGGRVVRCSTEERRSVLSDTCTGESPLTLITGELEQELAEFRSFWQKSGIDYEHGGIPYFLDPNRNPNLNPNGRLHLLSGSPWRESRL